MYKKGTPDWNDQYEMLLPDGITCGDCEYSAKCKRMFGGNDANTSCQFFPSQYSPIQQVKEEISNL